MARVDVLSVANLNGMVAPPLLVQVCRRILKQEGHEEILSLLFEPLKQASSSSPTASSTQVSRRRPLGEGQKEETARRLFDHAAMTSAISQHYQTAVKFMMQAVSIKGEIEEFSRQGTRNQKNQEKIDKLIEEPEDTIEKLEQTNHLAKSQEESTKDQHSLTDLFGDDSRVDRVDEPKERLVEYYRPSNGQRMTVRVGNYLWNGARWMSDYIDLHPEMVQNRCILELGAGAALPSIMSVLRGAKKVVATDYPDEELIAMIRKNIDCLIEEKERRDSIAALGFLWGGQVEPLLAQLPQEKFDLVLMCDLVFNHSEHTKLLSSTLATLAEGGEAWCVFSHYRPWLKDRDLAMLHMASEQFDLQVEKVAEYTNQAAMFPNDPIDSDGSNGEQSKRDILRMVYAYKLTKKGKGDTDK